MSNTLEQLDTGKATLIEVTKRRAEARARLDYVRDHYDSTNEDSVKQLNEAKAVYFQLDREYTGLISRLD
jgi:hypothetical protein